MGGNESKAKVCNKSLYKDETKYNVVNKLVQDTNVQVELNATASNSSTADGLKIDNTHNSKINIELSTKMAAIVKQVLDMKMIMDGIMESDLNDAQKTDAFLGMQAGLNQEGSDAVGIASKDETESSNDSETIKKKEFNIESATQILATYKFCLLALANNTAHMGPIEITNSSGLDVNFKKTDELKAQVEQNAVSDFISKQLEKQGVSSDTIDKIQEKSLTAAEKSSNLDNISEDVSDTVKSVSEDVTNAVKDLGLGWFEQNKTIFIVVGVVIGLIILLIFGVIIFKSISNSKTRQAQMQYEAQVRMQQIESEQGWSPEQRMMAEQQRMDHEMAQMQYKDQRTDKYINMARDQINDFRHRPSNQTVPTQQQAYPQQQVPNYAPPVAPQMVSPQVAPRQQFTHIKYLSEEQAKKNKAKVHAINTAEDLMKMGVPQFK